MRNGSVRVGEPGPRILLYSHDTFGLGHLRRSRAIAIALAEAFERASILIVTGSPIVGRFDFPAGVDFVRVPGVVKLPSGDYATHNLSIDIAETTRLREQIIRSTAEAFRPDLIIVDKEASGFRGELLETLSWAKAHGTRIVLGVRDVLDDPEVLAQEWDRKGAVETIERFYDELWVYGLREMCDPLASVPLSSRMRARERFTGYLRREAPDWPEAAVATDRDPYVLITAGGGGDGDWLMDWALRAYETDPALDTHAVMVFGPFMAAEKRWEFEQRAAKFPSIEVMAFDSRLELLMMGALGVVAMGGYNTFCEILSFDKPAVIAPRTTPRLEQHIRAREAAKLGLTRMLPTLGMEAMDVETARLHLPAETMAEAIRTLPYQNRPSEAKVPRLLDGLETVVGLAAPWCNRSEGLVLHSETAAG
ncbi:MAG: glycosyltransferase [Pseudomonadota bacterium]